MRLTHKLLLWFGLLAIVLIAASITLARWSFTAGYRDHLNVYAMQRMIDLAPTLIEYYEQHGRTWEKLDRPTYRDLIHRNRLERGYRPRPRRPQPYAELAREEIPANRPRQPPPMFLFDGQDRYLKLGMELPDPDLNLRETKYPLLSAGQQIGALKAYTFAEYDVPLPTSMAQQQRTVSIMLGAFSLLVALAVGLILSGIVIRPLGILRQGVHRLANGDYDTKLESFGNDEIADLTRDVNTLSQQLAMGRSARQRWLADMSHEIRTPVGILAAELEAVRYGVMQADDERIRSFEQEVNRLVGLVDDLVELSYAEVGAIKYEINAGDLAATIRTSIHSKTLRLQELGFLLESEIPNTIRAHFDAKRIDQLMSNLLENAIAHTHSPGTVTIKLTEVRQRAVLTIEDSEPGVTDDEYAMLFEPFYRGQADNQPTSHSLPNANTGLGLAICRSIVTNHGGTVNAAASSLGGLKITVELPCH
ncbi:MAG: ATP-binding protein [Pseudomonadota bacterium]